MKLLKLMPLTILLSLSSCFTQPSAPIEYNDSSLMRKGSAVEKIKYSNKTEIALDQDEPIRSIEAKPVESFEKVTFQAGNSLEQIANDYLVSENSILIANYINDKSDLVPGRELIIPKVTIHRVSENETLESIAIKYNHELNLLAKLNNLQPPFKVRPGEELEIITEPSLKADNARIISRSINPQEIPISPKAVTLIPKKAPIFIMPLAGTIKYKFREASGIKNEGIVFAATFREPVKAVSDGVVTLIGNKPESFGNFVIIKHTDNSLSAYAHLNDVIITKGHQVKQGDIIGHVGKTGNATGPELYFALKLNNKPVDPLTYFNKE